MEDLVIGSLEGMRKELGHRGKILSQLWTCYIYKTRGNLDQGVW